MTETDRPRLMVHSPTGRIHKHEHPWPPETIPRFLRRGYIAAGRRPLLRVLARVRAAWRAVTR